MPEQSTFIRLSTPLDPFYVCVFLISSAVNNQVLLCHPLHMYGMVQHEILARKALVKSVGYIRTYIHTYVRTYVHICIHTYIHTSHLKPCLPHTLTHYLFGWCSCDQCRLPVLIQCTYHMYVHTYIHAYICTHKL